MSARTHSRQRSLSNQRPMQPQPYNSKGKETASESPFEPCAATGSLFLYAEGSSVVCLHHDTLALERRFDKHTADIEFICVDNVSERGQGRLVVTYDVGRTAIVWDLLTGEQISRFASYEPLTVAAWMRNGNLTFGNEKGELILFEPSTSEHVSARTIFDPVTAIAPSADCRTFAIGYRNGSILLAAIQPTFTILHTLSTSRAPAPISALAWHASSSKQKSDMLATNTGDGDLRVWSVAKPPGSSQPRVIRTLHRSDVFTPSRSWISWSKNGRILQFFDGVTWAWDVRTKDVTYQSIPTVEFIRGIAAYGPTGTLFTMGPEHTIQQYEVDTPQMVQHVQHIPQKVPQTPPQAIFTPIQRSDSESEFQSPQREIRYGVDAHSFDNTRAGAARSGHSHGHRRSHSQGSMSTDPRLHEVTSPAMKTEKTGTSISLGVQSNPAAQAYSPSSTKSGRKGSRLRQEVIMSPAEKPVPDLFPFTRARLSDVPYQQPKVADDTNLTPDDLRKQMLHVVFGWQDDIRSLISDELIRQPIESANAVFLSRWLGGEPSQTADGFKSVTPDPALDWMRLALSCIGNQPGTKRMAQVFTQKLLTQGDVHAAACLLMAIGEYNDAIEVYVSRNFHMEAILLTCLLMPSDWQRQSFLVRKWGEHVVQLSQHHLAVRCFSCTGVEPTDPWTSPTAQNAAQALQDGAPFLQPSIYHKTMERRGLQDPSPQATQAPPVRFQVTSPGTGRQTPQDGGLKLITSFGAKDHFKFPGLMSDEGTPINAALATPIADSAMPRSAVSPGGLGSYKLNNMRSIGGALASRAATPGTNHKIRLPSIGETPIETDRPPFPKGLVPRAPPTPADSGSDKEKGKPAPVITDKQQAQAQLPALLTPARYDPNTSIVSETPQTAVNSLSSLTFSDKLPSEIERSVSVQPRGTSRSRKPEGLSVATRQEHSSSSSQELLQPSVYGESIKRPATTTAVYGGRSEMSPPNTGNSLNSLKSLRSPASTSGRSLDQYISSLEQAQYYKTSRSRGNSVISKQSRDDISERRFKAPARDSEDDRKRTGSTAKRSPSSPVPMSPNELRLHTASVESFDSTYLSTNSYNNRLDGNVMAESGLARDEGLATASRSRHRSRSRADGKSRNGSRAASRRRSPDRETGQRGRSKSRKEGSATRSPESPVPMIPSEEDLRNAQHVDPALKFVSQNRQRLNRSSSRRDSSSDQRSARLRSRSRQPEVSDTALSRKSSFSMRAERQHRHDQSQDSIETESTGLGIERVSSTSEAEPKGLRDLQQLPYSRRKELAQAELEARRLSLTRRPSAPAVPLPGQRSFFNQNVQDQQPPLVRAQTDQSVLTLSSLSSINQQRAELAGLGRARSQTPRPMKHPAHGQKSVPELANLGEVLNGNTYQPPMPLESTYQNAQKGRSDSFHSPEIPFDMPKHPAFDVHLATSRPGSQNAHDRTASPARAVSRDRRNVRDARSEYPVMTIGEEDYDGFEAVSNLPPIVPELQHLAMPPPPPPAPLPPQEFPHNNFTGGLRIQTENLPVATNIPLPRSAYPGDPSTAMSPSESQRRDRSNNDKQFAGKFRTLVGGRMRSRSRGRSQSRNRDNAARSPNPGEESTSPYESIPTSQHVPFSLATVTESR